MLRRRGGINIKGDVQIETWHGTEYVGITNQRVQSSTMSDYLDPLTPFKKAALLYIHHLYLQESRMERAQDCDSTFANLCALNMNNNSLTEISDSICQLTQLVCLDAKDNFLNEHSLPKNLRQLSNLHVLYLSGNEFRRIPEEILYLKCLIILDVSYNQIDEIPKDIGKLKRLRSLLLESNQLKTIPPEIGGLEHLDNLLLANNQLTSLPLTMSSLKNLRWFAVDDNRLTAFPPEILTLKNLIKLSVSNNPLLTPFEQEPSYDVSSLQELAAECIRKSSVTYTTESLPRVLRDYVEHPNPCQNLTCKEAYFGKGVTRVKFMNFCGNGHLPIRKTVCCQQCGIEAVDGACANYLANQQRFAHYRAQEDWEQQR